MEMSAPDSNGLLPFESICIEFDSQWNGKKLSRTPSWLRRNGRATLSGSIVALL